MKAAKGKIALPMFAENERGKSFHIERGQVWRIGRAVYLFVGDRWFRLGPIWVTVDGGRIRTREWLPSRGPKAGSMGYRIHPPSPSTPCAPSGGLRLVVDNTRQVQS